MKWGLSWGPRPPYQVKVRDVIYEVRTHRNADSTWTAFGDVNGECLEATGSTERDARLNWRIQALRLAPPEAEPTVARPSLP
jgi:hypothetical protein